MLTHSNSATLWEKVGEKDTPAVLILSIHTQGCKDTSNGAMLWAALKRDPFHLSCNKRTTCKTCTEYKAP